MARSISLTDDRLTALYVGEAFGGNNTMKAKVIRELIDDSARCAPGGRVPGVPPCTSGLNLRAQERI